MDLQTYLAEHGITQSELADRLGVAASTLSRISRGLRDPGAALQRRIYAATGGLVTPADLLALEPIPRPAPSPDGNTTSAAPAAPKRNGEPPAESKTCAAAAPPDPNVIDVPSRRHVDTALLSRVGGIEGWARRVHLDPEAVRRALKRHGGKRIHVSRLRGTDTEDILRDLRALVDDPVGPAARIEQVAAGIGMPIRGGQPHE